MTFTSPPIALDDVWYIEPQGKLHGSHVTPTDHTYVNIYQRQEYERHFEAVRAGQMAVAWVPTSDVRSPADGYIVSIDAFPFGPAPYGYTGTLEDYRVEIWHTCTVSTIFIHLGGLAPEILAQTGEIGSGGRWSSSVSGAIPVKAGQAVGKAGGQGVDFSVHDTSMPLNGLVIPSHYNGEPWKIYTADPFDYYEGDLKLRMLEKNPRTAEPKGGKIDYDIDGRLVGNWFLDGTVDYSGGSSDQMCGNRPCPYWTGHLSIAYDHVDPSQIRISIGADVGIYEEQCRICQSVYGVKGNGPDPAGISVASGLIKYDLVAREFVGELRIETRNLENQVLGAFLAQMLDERSMKMEVVAGLTASQATGFSDAASIYRR